MFKHRLNSSYRHAVEYVKQFPSPVTSMIAKLVSYIAGSFAAVILFISLVDESLLEGHVSSWPDPRFCWNEHVYFYFPGTFLCHRACSSCECFWLYRLENTTWSGIRPSLRQSWLWADLWLQRTMRSSIQSASCARSQATPITCPNTGGVLKIRRVFG